jgi:hypothetical protein
MFPVIEKNNRFGVIKGDYSAMHADIRDWDKLDNEFYHYVTTPQIGVTGAQLGFDSIDFVLKSNRFDGEYLKETLRINAVSVTFSEHENQTNGFDQVDFSDDDYISMDGNYGETMVYVEIKPFAGGNFWVRSSNPGLLTIDNSAEKQIVNEKEVLTLKVIQLTLTEKHEFIEIRSGSSSGTLLKKLNVMIYRRKNVQKIYFDRITDLNSHGTNLSSIVSSPQILNELNCYYRQSVIKINQIDGIKQNDTCAIQFDLNGNGMLDYYYYGLNEEFEIFSQLYNTRLSKVTNCPKVVQFKTLLGAYRIDSSITNINKGATIVKLEGGIGNLQVGSKCLFGKDNYEIIEIISVDNDSNTVTVKPPLNEYDNTDHKVRLVTALAGLATGTFLIVTNDNGDCANVMGHEILHSDEFGHLRDVKENDNLMYYTRTPGSIKLRYRTQTNYKVSDRGLSGFDQWTNINRNDINEVP